MVSHDNFFVNRVAEHLFVFEGDGIVRDFQGSYTDYLDYREDLAQQQAQLKRGSASAAADSAASSNIKAPVVEVNDSEDKKATKNAEALTQGGNLSYSEKKEFSKLEKEIAKLAAQVVEVEEKISNSSGSGYSVLAEWTKELDKLKFELSVKEDRWIELAEK